MIYYERGVEAEITQGDIIGDCPLFGWSEQEDRESPLGFSPVVSHENVVVLTQACDLANRKLPRAQVAVIHDARELVEDGVLLAKTIRDQIRRHQVFGWYFLPAEGPMQESLVDLRDIHTVPIDLLEERIRNGQRVASLATPYREHLAQHFAVTYSRIALPEPYETLPE